LAYPIFETKKEIYEHNKMLQCFYKMDATSTTFSQKIIGS